jgi:hypothetical protein
MKTLCDTNQCIAVALVHGVKDGQQISSPSIGGLGWTFDELLPAAIKVRS